MSAMNGTVPRRGNLIMPRLLASTLCALALFALTSTRPALAAPGTQHTHASTGLPKGTFIVSAERLFGLSVNRTTTGTNNGDVSVDHTGFGLLLSSPSTVHMLPRMALDVAIIDGLTVGAGLGFFVGDRQTVTDNNATTTTAQGPTTTAMVLAPRAGYALHISSIVSFWIRAGFTYYRTNSENDRTVANVTTATSDRTSGLAFDVEPTFLFQAFDHLAFTAAIIADLPLSGDHTVEARTGNVTTSRSVDQTVRNVGVVASMLGMF
jgi:hypothetical protein